jgi:hypothetical protein
LDNGGERTTRSRRRRCRRRVHLVDFNTRRTRSDFSEGSLISRASTAWYVLGVLECFFFSRRSSWSLEGVSNCSCKAKTSLMEEAVLLK